MYILITAQAFWVIVANGIRVIAEVQAWYIKKSLSILGVCVLFMILNIHSGFSNDGLAFLLEGYDLPKEFEKFSKTGVEINVELTSDRSDTFRTAKLLIKDNVYRLRDFSAYFFRTVRAEYVYELKKILKQGVPKGGLKCLDHGYKLPTISVICDDNRLIIKFEYDSSTMSGKLYLDTLLLNISDRGKKRQLHLPPSTSKGMNGIVRYDLSTSFDSKNFTGSFSSNSIVSEGHQHFILGLDASYTKANSGKATSDVNLYDAVFVQDFQGKETRIGKISRYAIGSDIFGNYKDIVGILYGDSHNSIVTRYQETSVPIPVNMLATGKVEIYRDGTLIDTQYFAQGLHYLKTQTLPIGIYAVDLKIYQGDILVSEKQEIIYKEYQDEKAGNKFWIGKVYNNRKASDAEVAGGSFTRNIAMGVGYQIAAQISNQGDSEYTFIQGSVVKKIPFIHLRSSVMFNGKKSKSFNLGATYASRNFNTGISYNRTTSKKYGMQQAISGNMRWRLSEAITSNTYLSYSSSRNKRYYFSTELNYRQDNWNLSLSHSRRSNENIFGINGYIQLGNSTSLRSSINRNASSNAVTYSKSLNDSLIDYFTVTGGIETQRSSGQSTHFINGYTTFTNPRFYGDAGLFYRKGASYSGFGNVHGGIYFPGGFSSGQHNSAVLLEINEASQNKLTAVTENSHIPLLKRKNIIPVQSFGSLNISVETSESSTRLVKVENDFHRIVSYPGNIHHIKILSYGYREVMGRLINHQKKGIAYQTITNRGQSQAVTDSEGVFSIKVRDDLPKINWKNCEYNVPKPDEEDDAVIFLGDIVACNSPVKNFIAGTQ